MLPGTVDGMKHVCYFRHALALDERRVKFLPEYAYGGRAMEGQPEKSGDTPQNRAPGESGDMSQKEKPKESEDSIQKETPNETPNDLKVPPHTLEVWFAGTHSDMYVIVSCNLLHNYNDLFSL